MSLSPTQIAFAEAYLQTNSATEAYARTHPKAARNTCWTNGNAILRNTEVAQFIEERLEDVAMSSNEILKRLTDQARADIMHFVRQDDEGFITLDLTTDEARAHSHLLKSITITNKVVRTSTEGKGKQAVKTEIIQQSIKADLIDAQEALDKLGRYYKLWTDKGESSNRTYHIQNFFNILVQVYGKAEAEQAQRLISGD